MPRLPPSLLRRARRINPLLPLLLRPCRDLRSAHNELRWLREHALSSTGGGLFPRRWQDRLIKLCVERSRGKPLQYILGSQPFGDLNIICRPGVLIPRPETEAYTAHLARLILNGHVRPFDILSKNPSRLRILDLCTGSGCISLLLYAILGPKLPNLEIHGFDVSAKALDLANLNLRYNIAQSHLSPVSRKQIRFEQADVFEDNAMPEGKWDVLISNPPYISPFGFDHDTSRSVRKYEPKIALVPPIDLALAGMTRSGVCSDSDIGDIFYPRLLSISKRVDAKVVLMEVADMKQAERVVALARQSGDWSGSQIWRDWPDQASNSVQETTKVDGETIGVIGEGNGRSVLLWRLGR